MPLSLRQHEYVCKKLDCSQRPGVNNLADRNRRHRTLSATEKDAIVFCITLLSRVISYGVLRSPTFRTSGGHRCVLSPPPRYMPWFISHVTSHCSSMLIDFRRLVPCCFSNRRRRFYWCSKPELQPAYIGRRDNLLKGIPITRVQLPPGSKIATLSQVSTPKTTPQNGWTLHCVYHRQGRNIGGVVIDTPRRALALVV